MSLSETSSIPNRTDTLFRRQGRSDINDDDDGSAGSWSCSASALLFVEGIGFFGEVVCCGASTDESPAPDTKFRLRRPDGNDIKLFYGRNLWMFIIS
jgi:hypothetical protein